MSDHLEQLEQELVILISKREQRVHVMFGNYDNVHRIKGARVVKGENILSFQNLLDCGPSAQNFVAIEVIHLRSSRILSFQGHYYTRRSSFQGFPRVCFKALTTRCRPELLCQYAQVYLVDIPQTVARASQFVRQLLIVEAFLQWSVREPSRAGPEEIFSVR